MVLIIEDLVFKMEMKNMKKCALYTRVSTAMQAEKEYNSCDAQKDRILSYIKSQEDLEFTKEYSRAREKAFSEGMATTTQVSDANLAVAKAKIERLQTIYAWDVALSKLLYHSGQSDKFVSYMSRADARQGRY